MTNSNFERILGPTEEGGENDPLAEAYVLTPGQVVDTGHLPRPETSYMQTAVIPDVVRKEITRIVPLPPRSKNVVPPKISANYRSAL